MADTTRIFVVGTMAGAERVWRKFVNSVALDVYKIDAALLVGGLGAADEAEAARWLALAHERLDVGIPLTVAEERDTLTLPDGRRVPILAGSRDLDDVIAAEAVPPALAICGGETGTEPRKFWIAETLCLDPGSDASRGGLCGFVADLGPQGVRVAVPVCT